jgi:hypothetical protein
MIQLCHCDHCLVSWSDLFRVPALTAIDSELLLYHIFFKNCLGSLNNCKNLNRVMPLSPNLLARLLQCLPAMQWSTCSTTRFFLTFLNLFFVPNYILIFKFFFPQMYTTWNTLGSLKTLRVHAVSQFWHWSNYTSL